MKVILLADVNGIGVEGDVCEVAEGHARNFLFPKHLAVPATDEAQHEMHERAAAERAAAERELHALQRLAEKLDGHELVIHSAATQMGKLYGAVNATTIAQALAAEDLAIESTWVLLEDPLKEVGEFPVRLQLPHGLEAELMVIIASQPEDERRVP